jgi:hypothetical protein
MHVNMQLKLPKYALIMQKYALKNSKTSTSNIKNVIKNLGSLTDDFAVVGGVRNI